MKSNIPSIEKLIITSVDFDIVCICRAWLTHQIQEQSISISGLNEIGMIYFQFQTYCVIISLKLVREFVYMLNANAILFIQNSIDECFSGL